MTVGSGTSSSGGEILIQSGTKGQGGAVYLTVGSGDTGSLGQLILRAGFTSDSTTSSSIGGAVSLISGYSSVTDSGSILLQTMNAGTSGASGNLVVSTETSSSGNTV